MTNFSNLLDRNRNFASKFTGSEMPLLPKLRTVVLACGDARVDPAHILGLDLGDAVVIRNNGGRVTSAFIDEITVLAFMVTQLTKGAESGFDVILMQHTQCGAEHFANPDFQKALHEQTGVDVSEHAITDQAEDLLEDLNRLRDAAKVPASLTVSALLYDVKTGSVREIAAPRKLADLRQESANDTNTDVSTATL